MNQEFLRDVALRYPEDILPPYDTMLGMSGMEVIFLLAEVFGGTTVYIPTLRRIFALCIEQDISQRYRNGEKVSDLARKYGYTCRTIKKIVKRSA